MVLITSYEKKELSNTEKITQNMGERTTMFFLHQYLEWEVEYVDYVGADLIALDKVNNKRYAISVKTRKLNEKWNGDKPIYLESKSVSLFKDDDAAYLREFANDMNMEPLVAFVIVFQKRKKEKGNNSAYLFLIGLDHLIELRDNTNFNSVNYTKDGFRLSFGNQNNAIQMLRDDPMITRFEMEITDHSISKDFGNCKTDMVGKLDKEYWSKQQGAFGEYLALWYLGKNNKMRGYHVDSNGADLILIDTENKKDQYAVSVKTFTYQNKRCYEFEAKHKNNLIEFAKKWSDPFITEPMEPMICFNLVCPDKIYLIAFTIDHVKDIQKQGANYIDFNKSGSIIIRYSDEMLNRIKMDDEIIFKEITIS